MNSLLGSGRALGDGMPHYQLTQQLPPNVLMLYKGLERCPLGPYLLKFWCMLTPWHMASIIIIITLFGCLKNVFSSYHFNPIVSVSHLNPIDLDRRKKINFPAQTARFIVDATLFNSNFKHVYRSNSELVGVFNFRKFPKVIFFLLYFHKLF